MWNGKEGARSPTFENMKFLFQGDMKGNVAALWRRSSSRQVKDIVFAKKPDARLFDPAYLARFTGEYELAGQTITVSLKGNTLTAQPTGQTRSELVPGVDGDFTPKLSRAVSWHFVTDASGKVTAAELRQPNTVLTAKRK